MADGTHRPVPHSSRRPKRESRIRRIPNSRPTLLRIAAGLLRPSTGTLEIRTAARRPAAMVFQDYGIYDWKTVRANVRFGLDIQRLPRREANARADGWLARMGLSDFADAYPATLSGGMH